MPERDRYRLTPSSECGYGPGRWVLQRWYPALRLWCDVGDPRHAKDAAELLELVQRGIR